MKNEIEQGLHEKLCAYILGEASDEVRTDVERALAESAELRAERARIESTIGLVQATMGGSEELPRSAHAILADAQPPRGRPWHRTPGFRIAAGFAAVAIAGVIASRALRHEEDAPEPFVYRIFGSDEEHAPIVAAERSEKLAFADEAKKDKNAAEVGLPSSRPPPALFEKSVDGPTSIGVGSGGSQPSITVASLDAIDQQGDPSQPYSREAGNDAQRAEVDRSQATSGGEGSTAIGVGFGGYSGGGRPSGPAGRKLSTSPPIGAAGGRSMQGYRGPGDSIGNSMPSSQGVAPAAPAEVAAGLLQMGYTGGETGSGTYREPLKGLGYAGEDDGDDFRFRRDGDFSVVLDRVRSLTPAEREQWLDLECRRITERCRRWPNERPRDMFFRFYGDNPFELAAIDPLSTFSIDVDTASYTLARRYLNEGNIPQKAQIRTEEFVNYFKADVAAPTEGTFAIHTDLTPSRFSTDKARSMLRVVVRGKEIAKEERQPLNITFVVDTSGSMKEQNRLELVKHAMRLLANELGANDALAIVAFSSDARMILPMTSASQKGVIESAIFPLQPAGSTNAAAGIRMGYEEALAKINPSGQNRVVLLSDGVANTGQTDQDEITKSVQLHREKGIYLNTIGVGMNNHNDVLLEQLADKGDGVCSYVDSADEARKAIVERFTGAFETIARDVKIQVDFDPAQVERYRLLGYENRGIADKDFRNDAIDAGEVGAGHQVTALYEIERAAGASERPLATVRLRWKAPRSVNAPKANEEATEIESAVLASQQTGFEGAGVGYRRAVIVAQFAEFLRRSVHARGDSLDDLIAEADKLVNETGDPETAEFVVLVHKSKQLILNALPGCDDLCQTIDAVRRNSLLRCQEELLAKEGDAKLLGDLEAENRKLEERIRELLRRRLESREK